MQKALPILDELKKLPDNQVDKAKALMTQLKTIFIHFSTFLCSDRVVSASAEEQKEILLVRSALETIALYYARNERLFEFSTVFKQLKSYYACQCVNSSPLQNLIIGLNLLRLLTDGKMAEFHSEVELLPIELHDDIYVKYSMELELYLMEGSYKKLRTLIEHLPAKEYAPFMQCLVRNSVRAEIASCIEKSYRTLKISHAKQLLIFNSDQETLQYIQNVKKWPVNGDSIIFKQLHQYDNTDEIAKNEILRQLRYVSSNSVIV